MFHRRAGFALTLCLLALSASGQIVGPLTFDDILRTPNGSAHEVSAPGFRLIGGFVSYRTTFPANRFYTSSGPFLCVGCMNPFILYTAAGARNLTMQIVAASPGAQIYDGGRVYFASAGDTVVIEQSAGVTYIGTWGPTAFPSVAIDNVSYERPVAVRFELDEASDATARRVLIARHRSDVTYPSPAQKADGRIEIRASAGAPGKRIYFRVVDPPDTAPYIPVDDRKPNDNVGGPGRLTLTEVVSDASGNVTTELLITDRYAGDNYRVEASTDPDFRCAPDCPRTGVLTAWKRAYLENDLMYKRGAFVAQPIGPRDRIAVTDIRPFLGQEGKTFEIIHADEGATAGAPRRLYRERHVIGSLVQRPGAIDGEIVLLPGATITHEYGPEKDRVLSDAVGLLSGNPADDYFRVSDHVVQTLFAQAYVEYVPLAPTIPVVPHIDSWETRPHQPRWVGFAEKWSESDPLPNHQHIISASKVRNDPVRAEAMNLGGGSYVYIYVEAIGTNQTLGAEVLAHEVAHLWRTNSKANPDASEHCEYSAWNASGKVCQARDSYTCTAPTGGLETCPAFLDGVGAFHYVETPEGVDSEYRWIRERCEPVPNAKLALNGRSWMSYSPLPCH